MRRWILNIRESAQVRSHAAGGGNHGDDTKAGNSCPRAEKLEGLNSSELWWTTVPHGAFGGGVEMHPAVPVCAGTHALYQLFTHTHSHTLIRIYTECDAVLLSGFYFNIYQKIILYCTQMYHNIQQ